MLPELPNWEATKQTLHQAAQVLSLIRNADINRLPNHLHHSLIPAPDGASTGLTLHMGTFDLHYPTATVTHSQNGMVISEHKLSGHTQASLFEAIADEIHEMDYDVALPSPSNLAETPFTVQPDHAIAFMTVSRAMFEAIAVMCAHCLGFQTPLVLWSHGFDLSTLWFQEGSVEEQDAHMNFGFSPGTDDHPEPYIYAYAWPVQPALRDALPPGWEWESNWSTHGASLRYSAFARATDPAGEVSGGLFGLYQAGMAALRKDT